jgi:WD40 repeat protein
MGTTLFSGAGSFGSSKGEIKQWNAYSGKLERTQPQPDGGVAALALSSDGALLVSANGLQDTLSLWDTRSFKKLRTLGNDVNSEMSTVNTLAFMPGTKLLASGHYDGNIRLWDASTGKLMHTLSGHSDDVTSPSAFTSGGTPGQRSCL